MGDPRRFDQFAALIHRNFPRARRVADVAGGKGYLQTALRERGYEVVTFDKRKGRKDRPKMRYQYRYFDSTITEPFDLLVGMHPDGATDVIIKEAAARRVPFVICPCCAISTATAYWGARHGIGGWVEHLKAYAKRLGFEVREMLLKINGRNLVLVGVPLQSSEDNSV